MIVYSQSHSDWLQESFVISMLKEKTNGYYIEVGSGLPFKGNNTFILENVFDWHGVGLDLNQGTVSEYNKNRKNKSICVDAITFDYKNYLEKNNFPKQIDFLQIDIDSGTWQKQKYSGNGNLLALVNIPLTDYRFSVITFEHEEITNYKNKSIKNAQREILSGFDYILLGSTGLEDWWIDPKAIPKEIYENQYFIDSVPKISKTVSNLKIKGDYL